MSDMWIKFDVVVNIFFHSETVPRMIEIEASETFSWIHIFIIIRSLGQDCNIEYLDITDVPEAVAKADENFAIGSRFQKLNDPVAMLQRFHVPRRAQKNISKLVQTRLWSFWITCVNVLVT